MIPTARWCRNSYWKLWKAFLGVGQDFEFYFIGDADVWLRSWYLVMILKMNLIKIYVWTCDMTSRWTQPSGPLCLWQCLWYTIFVEQSVETRLMYFAHLSWMKNILRNWEAAIGFARNIVNIPMVGWSYKNIVNILMVGWSYKKGNNKFSMYLWGK